MKKSIYYNETSESEADLTDSKEFVCSYVFKMRFLSENARKNSEIENGLKKKKASLEFVPKNKTNVKRQQHLRGVVGVQVIVMAVAVLVPIIHLTQPQQYPTKGRARQRPRHHLKQKLPSPLA